MQIVLLDEARFDNFAINHPDYNFYQSSNYGRFMSKNGHNSYYLGLSDESGNIKAATLIIVKNDNNDKRKMAYAPRGFLIDWNNDQLVSEFTNLIKDFLAKRGFTYLKIDPMIIYKEHNLDGSEINNGTNNENFIKKLQSLGYIHMGYNNGLETSKPRWNSMTYLSKDIIQLYNSISKEAREKIMESYNLGNKIYKGSMNDISLLYNLINQINPPLEYYLDYYQFFSVNNGFEVYFTKLEPVEYVNSSKKMYEKEEARNNELNMQIQDFNNPNKDMLINEKIKSDELVSKYKKDMIEAINLFQQYPNGIVTAGIAVIKYGRKATFFVSGVNERFKDHHPEYLLRWHLMQEFAKQGYELVDFNGIIGNFSNSYGSLLERELANKIVEYVGEFDLVINKKSYYTGNKINPILNWLNTPI